MEDLLVQVGLNGAQAKMYLLLLDQGESSPPVLAKSLGITRTNAYKVLDSLAELGLAQKSETRKKIVYQASDPSALASLVASERNRVIALEHSVREATRRLRGKYLNRAAANTVSVQTGSDAIVSAYEQQAARKTPIYFVKSRADIPSLGFETMDRLRRLPGTFGTERHGITPDAPEAALNPAVDKRGNLHRTWIDNEAYTAPVEWTVSGDELLIINFDDDGSVIRITNPVVASSFQKLWEVLDKSLRASPEYKKLPVRAKREI